MIHEICFLTFYFLKIEGFLFIVRLLSSLILIHGYMNIGKKEGEYFHCITKNRKNKALSLQLTQVN